MAKDRDRPSPREETIKVRVRAKNAQIGRRPSAKLEGEEETQHVDPDELETARPGRAPASAMMDDDATEIASSPPRLPREEVIVRRTPIDPREKAKKQASAPIAKPKPVARPRGRMDIPGTEGAGALAAQARLQRMADGLPQTNHPLLKVYRSLLTDQEISALERALNGELDTRDIRAAGTSPKRAIERVIHGDDLNALVLEERAIWLRALAADPREVETPKAAARILEKRIVGSLRPQERAHLFELFRLLAPRSQMLLADLIDREVHGSSALLDRDFQDQGLVAHLYYMAAQRSLAPRIETAGLGRNDALGLVLASIAHPEEIALEEGANGVLGLMEFALADVSPAEHARLWRALTSGELIAELPGEGTLDLGEYLRARPALTFGRGETPLRSALEMLAALAHPRSGGTRSAFIMPGGHGIDADVIARALGFLYGVGFTVAAGSTAALRQLDRVRDHAQRVPPAFISLLYDGGERLFLFDHFGEDRVFFRSPRGASSKPKGARRHDPDRLIEDPDRGLESVSSEDFNAQVGVALVPRT